MDFSPGSEAAMTMMAIRRPIAGRMIVFLPSGFGGALASLGLEAFFFAQ